MGSYDKMPQGWGEFGDEPWNPQHVIVCNSRWSGIDGGDRHDHPTVELVAICYAAARDEKAGMQVWPCTWLLEGRYDDGSVFHFECGLPTRVTGPGRTECTGGHEHVTAEQRDLEGWDYADEDEADGLMRAGTRPVDMNGRPLR